MCLAVPGQVESIHDDGGVRMGRVNFGGVVKEVCLAYLPDLAVGDFTIVHVGFALCRIDEAAARDTLRCFAELGLLEEELEQERELAELGGADDAGSPPS
ncbi:MAG: HypC/HybG/HupF family hydrogenase formation chaperone [Planctomycetia bacterium]